MYSVSEYYTGHFGYEHIKENLHIQVFEDAVTTEKNSSSLLYLFHLVCAPFFVIICRGVEQ